MNQNRGFSGINVGNFGHHRDLHKHTIRQKVIDHSTGRANIHFMDFNKSVYQQYCDTTSIL